jgi:hypothetical protein
VSEHEREDNDDAAWLLARERGQPGPTVSAATTARYARLQSLITDLPAMPAGVSPRAGWQRDVLAAIDATEAEPEHPRNPAPVRPIDSAPPERMRTRPRRWAAATAIFAAAAVVAILLAMYRDRSGAPDGRLAEPTVAFEVAPADRAHRSSDPSVGDTLIVRGGVEGPGELRVYDAAGVEQARCTVPAPDCSVDHSGKRTTLRLTMPLRVPGALRVILLTVPLGGPSGGLDADVKAAVRAGIAVTPRELVDVH